MSRLSRADFLKFAVAAGSALFLPPLENALAAMGKMQTKPIPKTGEELPVIGLGTWQTFDIGGDPGARAQREEVLRLLFEAGGSMIDSSPMYGRSESVVGDLLHGMQARDKAFLATKVWIWGEEAGVKQMNESFRRFRADVVDLMQIHNLVDWKTQLRTIRKWKDDGRLRYIGVTHYTTSAFDELAAVLRSEPVDFVQLPYSIGVRDAEAELLPLAADQGVAVLVNRPLEGGDLIQRGNEKRPGIATELGIKSWGELFLKYVLAHPAVTCAIPGTANPRHMADNLAAGTGPALDAAAQAALRSFKQSD